MSVIFFHWAHSITNDTWTCQCLIKNKILDGRIYLDKENSSGAQSLYLHVQRFEALLSIICRGISRSQVVKVLRHKNVAS